MRMMRRRCEQTHVPLVALLPIHRHWVAYTRAHARLHEKRRSMASVSPALEAEARVPLGTHPQQEEYSDEEEQQQQPQEEEDEEEEPTGFPAAKRAKVDEPQEEEEEAYEEEEQPEEDDGDDDAKSTDE
jgi:hypothetical protein